MGLAIALKTLERSAEKVSRFDERGADVSRLGTYLGRWTTWVGAGVELKGCGAPDWN
jgi:hypothetical protein